MTATHHDDKRPLGRLVTIAEVADALGVDVRHVRRLVHEKRIPYIKWGHLLRFDPAEIRAWIDQNRRHPSRPRIDT
jgi:excisionase family DNA binding protein